MRKEKGRTCFRMLWDRNAKSTRVLTNTHWCIVLCQALSRQREQAVNITSLFLRSLESPHSLIEGWDAPGIPIMVPRMQNCINVRAQVWLGWSATLLLGAFQPPRDFHHPPILSQSSFLSKGSLPSQPKNHVPPNFLWPFSTHPFSTTFSEKQSAFTAFSSSPWLHSNSRWLNGTLH